MAKRRFQYRGVEKRPEDLTPQERRERRREDRLKEGRGKKPKTPKGGWRRGIVPSIVVAIVIVIILVVYIGVGSFLKPPCVSFGPIPPQSGVPAFPTSNTTDFSVTWCPNAAPVFQTYPFLAVVINGATIALPSAIGTNSNFTSYVCTLPIHTQTPSSARPSGTISLESAWPYEYTLGQFFSVWHDSYVSAYINATYSTHTIDYSATDLLGLPVDATHSLTLFVDNKPSSAGPNLVLNTLDGLPGPSPGCLGSIYGTGHTVEIVYKAQSASAFGAGVRGPVLGTAASGPSASGGTFDSPMPRVTSGLGSDSGLTQLKLLDLSWLALRAGA
ncbi:MAG TPA: hypothetical protein VIZ68_07225 [Thermoplasmata archaeon]